MFKGLWNSRWRRSEDPLRAALGSLEREVMDVVWQTDQTTVREVQAALPRRVAYTTVMTTLDRLYKKGFVVRVRHGRAFLYSPACSREEAEAAAADGIVRALLSSGSEAARPFLSNLVDAVGAGNDALLDELERLVRDKRRRLRRETLRNDQK
jgi:predicted transcriptional regulator